MTPTHTKLAVAWWHGETQVRLGALPQHLPRTAAGERTSLASVYRWSTRGLRGVRLRRFKAAGSWCTTVEELARWQVAQTEIAA